MKLLGKIVVILMAALMVAGATLALENSGALSSLTGGGHGGEGRGEWAGDGTTNAGSAFAAGERPERGEFPGGGRGGEGGNWAGNLVNMARNLAIIAAVVAGVGLLGWLSRQAATRRKLAQAEMPPPLKEDAIPEEKV